MSETGLDQIRQRKLQQLQQNMQEHEQVQAQAQEMEMKKEMLLKKILTPEAKARLTNVKLANPTMATQIEALLLYLHQSGQVQIINEEQLIAILQKIRSKKKEPKIIRK